MLLLSGGRVVCPTTGVDRVLDLRVANGVITELGEDLDPGGARVVDCRGAAVLPGFVDLVADLADPGFTWREDLDSGSRAAAAGGFTTVLASPATDPVVDSGAVVAGLLDLAAAARGARVLRAGAVTVGLQGAQLAEMGTMFELGCAALSDGGHALGDAAVLRNALEYARPFGAPVLLRPAVPALEQRGCMHEGDVSVQIGLRGIPAASEEIGLALVIALVHTTGARVHLTHLTTARAVRMLALAKADGLPITASVPARSLLLTDRDVRDSGYDSATRVLPPLRPEADRAALCHALTSGVVDAVCSDHSPWTRVEKEHEFERATPGAAGLETAFAAACTALEGDLGALARVLAVGPAAVLGRSARLARGEVADIVVVDPDAELEVGPPTLSKACNEPLRGRTLRGVVRMTLVDGRVVHGG